ncbi:MAG: hypothetical protein AAF358_05600 [Pseudomonadota bacterium]
MKALRLIFSLLWVAFLADAEAVELSADGTGSVLIFPVLSAENGLDTLINVHNVSDDAVVVRAVVRDGVTGQATLTLRILFRPRDTWVGTWAGGYADGPLMLDFDDSCVAGREPVDIEFFSARAFRPVAPSGQAWLEVFELGALPRDLSRLAAPGSCGDFLDLSRVSLDPADNRLSGDSQLVSVFEGFNTSVAPTALMDLGFPAEVAPLSVDRPNLSHAQPVARISGIVTRWANGIDAVSAVLAVRAVEAPFNVEPAIDARSDLVVTLPTRPFYDATDRAPFLVNTDPRRVEQGQRVMLDAFDRSGDVLGLSTVKCSPARPSLPVGAVISEPQLNLSFGRASIVPTSDTEPASVRGVSLCANLIPLPVRDVAKSGQFRLNLDAFEAVSEGGWLVKGLPLIPVTLTVVQNRSLVDNFGNQVLSNYGMRITQRIVRSIPERPRPIPQNSAY